YDGTNLQTQTLQFTPDSVQGLAWEQVAFLPAGLGPVPPPQEPGIPEWTIYLDTNNNGRLDTAEPSTTTDVNANYSFTKLPPGTYRRAEAQQSGWTQTAPAPVPPGTYTVTLASGQSIYGLDFGNHQNATPPPPPPPDQAPFFTSTPPNPGTATAGVPTVSG